MGRGDGKTTAARRKVMAEAKGGVQAVVAGGDRRKWKILTWVLSPVGGGG